MAHIDPLRVCKRKDEIVSVLTKMYIEQSPVLLWQRFKDKRTIHKGIIREIDKSKNVIKIMPLEDQWDFKFKNKTTLYFKGEEESILFKQAKMKLVDKKTLAIVIPQEIRLFEKRKISRVTFDPFLDDISFTLSNIGDMNNTEEILLYLFDVSEKGAAFRVPKHLGKLFYQGDPVQIIRIRKDDIKPPILAKILYINPFEYMDGLSRKMDFRMGVIFDKPLSKTIIKQLK